MAQLSGLQTNIVVPKDCYKRQLSNTFRNWFFGHKESPSRFGLLYTQTHAF